MDLLPAPPDPVYVMSPDGRRIATYSWGDDDAPLVLAVHGFSSSAVLNFHRTGWTRDLLRAGFRVLAVDQRGHGRSDKPHDPREYSLALLVDDLLTVLDTYLVDEAQLVGYSLGARVGWQAAIEMPGRLTALVLGGIPDGQPLTRVDIAQMRAFAAEGTPVADRITAAYVEMAAGMPGNDLLALAALIEGMRGGPEPDPDEPPTQPVLFATGSEDSILERSKRLAAATPHGTFFEIPGRHHFNAPTSRDFRDAAIDFVRHHR